MTEQELDDPKGNRTGNAICLKCDRPFWSTNKYNRICQTCKKVNSNYEIINDTYYGMNDVNFLFDITFRRMLLELSGA